MTDYPAPNPVTNLTAQWHQYPTSSAMQPGVLLSWQAPVIASGNGTVGAYYVYVLLENETTNIIESVLFKTVRKRAQRNPSQINSYSVSVPEPQIFFPFSWTMPNSYKWPNAPLSSPSVANSYSFQVRAFLAEANDVGGAPTGVTVYAPAINSQVLPSHLNPRFAITADKNVATIEQDSYEDVSNCVEMVLNTPKGWRSAQPAFGVDDPTFTNVDPNILKNDIEQWEPRAVTNVSIDNDDAGLTGSPAGVDQANVKISILDINYTA